MTDRKYEATRSEGDYRRKVPLVRLRYRGKDKVREGGGVKEGGVRGACTIGACFWCLFLY